MRARQAWMLAFAAAVGGGCWKAKSPWARRSNFDRDPLVMAHLTHPKDRDYARSESEQAMPDDVPPVQAASMSSSKKPAGAPLGYRKPDRGHAPDYGWLRGQAQRAGAEWRVQYGGPDEDRFGGRMPLAPTARLGMLREGDEVYVAGRLPADGAEPRYLVDSLILAK